MLYDDSTSILDIDTKDLDDVVTRIVLDKRHLLGEFGKSIKNLDRLIEMIVWYCGREDIKYYIHLHDRIQLECSRSGQRLHRVARRLSNDIKDIVASPTYLYSIKALIEKIINKISPTDDHYYSRQAAGRYLLLTFIDFRNDPIERFVIRVCRLVRIFSRTIKVTKDENNGIVKSQEVNNSIMNRKDRVKWREQYKESGISVFDYPILNWEPYTISKKLKDTEILTKKHTNRCRLVQDINKFINRLGGHETSPYDIELKWWDDSTLLDHQKIPLDQP